MGLGHQMFRAGVLWSSGLRGPKLLWPWVVSHRVKTAELEGLLTWMLSQLT